LSAAALGYFRLMGYGRSSGLITIIYLAIGAIVAGSHHYFEHVDRIKQVVEAALAVLLWPLVLLGVSMHF
jgi:cytochrome c oxidase subunit IV